jgi:DNA-binding CsgD family transcriptional regulator
MPAVTVAVGRLGSVIDRGLLGILGGDRGLRVVGAVGAYALTSRERDVLALLSSGRKNAEIAQALNVSVETTRTHVKHVYGKLGVSSRGELLGVER